MKSKSSVQREIAFYGLALAVAWAVRFAFLGRSPLTDVEATLALQALNLAHGQDVLLSAHPAYLLLTSFGMWLFGSGNIVARFWPALLGGLIVLAPAAFRRQLGARPAVLLAFFLALDPGLVALARQAGSASMAAAMVLLAFGLWLSGRQVVAAVVGGLALLCGPQVWPGLVGLGVVIWFAGPRQMFITPGDGPNGLSLNRAWVWALLATVLFAGTLFFFVPSGLSAMAASIPAYLSLWGGESGMPFWLLLIGLGVYEILALLFGLIGLVVGREQDLHRFLGVWALVALILAFAPPGRSVDGLVWVIVPMLALAARYVDRLLRFLPGEKLPVLGQAFLVTAVLTFISLDLLAISDNTLLQQDNAPEWLALAGALLLLLATSLLVTWGWGWRVARVGVVWSLLGVTLAFSFSAAWNASGLSGRGMAEIWQPGSRFADEDLMAKTLYDLEHWNMDGRFGADTVVVGLSSPALQWSLRDIPEVSYVDFLPQSSAPAMVITPEQKDLALAAEYRGQAFIVSQRPSWDQILPGEWLRWLYFREAPLEEQSLVLWVRTDLFPADQAGTDAGSNADGGSGLQ